MTVGDLIFEAAIMAGISDPRDGNVAPEIGSYGFRKLNDLVDLLATNRLAIYRSQRVGPFSVTAGMGDITNSAPITIGDGATWDTPRPVWIDYAGVIYTAGSTPRPELKMAVFTTKEWSEKEVKGVTSTLSRALIYDRIYNASGYGNIYLYPVPSESFQVVLYVPVAVPEFADDGSGNPVFSTVIALPPGYRMMLISNLATILCLGLKPIPEDVERVAIRTLADVKSSNVVTFMDALSCEPAVRPIDGNKSGWDWITGEIN